MRKRYDNKREAIKSMVLSATIQANQLDKDIDYKKAVVKIAVDLNTSKKMVHEVIDDLEEAQLVRKIAITPRYVILEYAGNQITISDIDLLKPDLSFKEKKWQNVDS